MCTPRMSLLSQVSLIVAPSSPVAQRICVLGAGSVTTAWLPSLQPVEASATWKPLSSLEGPMVQAPEAPTGSGPAKLSVVPQGLGDRQASGWWAGSLHVEATTASSALVNCH